MSIRSRDSTAQVGRQWLTGGREREEREKLTIARYSWERHVEVHV